MTGPVPSVAAAGERDGSPAAAGDGSRRPPADLVAVVGELLDPQTMRVVVETRSPEDGHLLVERREFTVRPVLAELRAAVMPSGQSGGGGRGGGLPLSLEALDVLDQLRGTVDVAMAQLGMRHRRHGRCEACGMAEAVCQRGGYPGPGGLPPHGPHFPDGPRCCSAHRHIHPDRAEDALRRLAVHPWPDAAARQSFAEQLRTLTDRARATLDGDGDAERIRDTRCPIPSCRAEYVKTRKDGATVRVPPLRVERSRLAERRDEPGRLYEADRQRGPVRGTRCSACGHFWPWEQMQGPRPGEPAGKLWDLLVADALAVARERAHVDHRAAELDRRGQLYTDAERPTATGLGLPHQPQKSAAHLRVCRVCRDTG